MSVMIVIIVKVRKEITRVNRTVQEYCYNVYKYHILREKELILSNHSF